VAPDAIFGSIIVRTLFLFIGRRYMGDAIRTGDRVRFQLPVFQGGSFFRGRQVGKPRVVGHKEFSGVVVRHSYGAEKGQHTFSIQLDDGSLKRVKGRNLYPNLIQHIVNTDSPDRTNPDSSPKKP
jgi:hypothetical protein